MSFLLAAASKWSPHGSTSDARPHCTSVSSRWRRDHGPRSTRAWRRTGHHPPHPVTLTTRSRSPPAAAADRAADPTGSRPVRGPTQTHVGRARPGMGASRAQRGRDAPAPHGSSRVPGGARGGPVDVRAVRDHRPVTRTSARLTRRVRHDFPPDLADTVVGQLTGVPETLPLCSQDAERMQASIVITAHGDYERFLAALQLVRDDWRDALVGSGLGDDDWPERPTDALGLPEGRKATCT